MMNTKRITLDAAAEWLAYNSKQAARKWCDSKRVQIIEEGRNQYIYEEDMINAIEMDRIKWIREKHPENWKDVYEAYLMGDKIKIYELTILKIANKKDKNNKYEPQSDQAKSLDIIFEKE